MSSTVLRLGLWILVIILALYVVHESFEESPVAELVPLEMLQKALALGGILIVAGLIMRVFEKGSRKVIKNRCVVCRTPIPHGGLYCREHLRRILHDEDERTHTRSIRPADIESTLSRRPPQRPANPTQSRPLPPESKPTRRE